jgi:hypothetical protein
VACLRKDHLEQLADFASFRQRDADAIQLVHFALGAGEFSPGSAFPLRQLNIGNRGVDGPAHERGIRFTRNGGKAVAGVLSSAVPDYANQPDAGHPARKALQGD